MGDAPAEKVDLRIGFRRTANERVMVVWNRELAKQEKAQRLTRGVALVRSAAKFKVGDHVEWNSEAGQVSGKIIAVHTKNVERKGYTHHASSDDPQYEIKSDKTDRIALHKGAALKKASK